MAPVKLVGQCCALFVCCWAGLRPKAMASVKLVVQCCALFVHCHPTQALQLQMPVVAARRYFDFEVYKNERAPIFSTAASWVALTRLWIHIDEIFHADLGQQDSWPDMAKSRYREIWRGDYDKELESTCTLLPASLDRAKSAMQARLREQLPCLSRLILNLNQLKAASITVGPAVAEEPKEPEAPGAALERDGNVTAAIASFGELTTQEKKSLVEKLNTEAVAKRKEARPCQATAPQHHGLMQFASTSFHDGITLFLFGRPCPRRCAGRPRPSFEPACGLSAPRRR
jgi:hypothetical protein